MRDWKRRDTQRYDAPLLGLSKTDGIFVCSVQCTLSRPTSTKTTGGDAENQGVENTGGDCREYGKALRF